MTDPLYIITAAGFRSFVIGEAEYFESARAELEALGFELRMATKDEHRRYEELLGDTDAEHTEFDLADPQSRLNLMERCKGIHRRLQAAQELEEKNFKLLKQLLDARGRKDVLWQQYYMKAMSDEVYDTFATLRDETIPALTKQVLARMK